MAELIIERHFDAPPDIVFDYLTQKNHLLKWWGPEAVHIKDNDLDLSRTGPWSSTMVSAEGTNFKVSGRVVFVNPPHSVKFTWGWHDDHDNRGHESIVLFEIEPANRGGTRFKLIHSGLPDEESVVNHNTGWSSSFTKLERLIK